MGQDGEEAERFRCLAAIQDTAGSDEASLSATVEGEESEEAPGDGVHRAKEPPEHAEEYTERPRQSGHTRKAVHATAPPQDAVACAEHTPPRLQRAREDGGLASSQIAPGWDTVEQRANELSDVHLVGAPPHGSMAHAARADTGNAAGSSEGSALGGWQQASGGGDGFPDWQHRLNGECSGAAACPTELKSPDASIEEWEQQRRWASYWYWWWWCKVNQPKGGFLGSSAEQNSSSDCAAPQ
ncbi:hypothetical protein CYMTET_18491 [Cymbomonas tetramitiformis]|uniref:Uncharacterized protein n=1 Tax=Cymbomonas tetramitiformis TaxID=36881 RepID=A0AAE0L694_9CHLO|nr:hypothetical protein CYMTET_18491 [Cymbomonas tetramitiformis]